ncbi:MAG: DUF302 domain-containing protein [Chloroflexota bacterium]
MASGYTYATTVAGSIEEIRARVEAALKDEGFGILTEIDVAATLKAKLGLDRPPYLILGACNAGLASRALEIDPSIGALLPCNVVLRRSDDLAETIVEIMDPIAALGIAGAAGVEPIAAEAAERLRRVLDALGAG